MALTMIVIDPTSSWFEITELPLVKQLRTITVNGKELLQSEEIFGKSSDWEAKLVNTTWLCRYPRCQKLIYDNGSEFKLNFEHLCDSYGKMHKPTTVKNPQSNAILERVHQVIGQMLRTSEIDMANSVSPNDVDVFVDNAAWAIRSTYHTVLKAWCSCIWTRHALWHSIHGRLEKDWKSQESLMDCSNEHENKKHIDYDYKVGDKVLIVKDGILRKSESKFGKEPWTITTVHTNGTIRVQCRTKSEWINICRVTPFTDSQVLEWFKSNLN